MKMTTQMFAIALTSGMLLSVRATTYDLEHHYATQEMLDTAAMRTEVPIYDPATKLLHLRTDGKGGYVSMPLGTPTFNQPNDAGATVVDDMLDFGQKRITHMNGANVDVAVLSMTTGFEDLSRDEAVAVTRAANDAVARYSKESGGRILGAAVLPTPYVDDAIKELERCICELGFSYWHTHSCYLVDGKPEHLYDAKYEPLIRRAAELGCAIYLHPTNSDDADMKDCGYMYSAAGLGFGQDVMRTSLRMIMNGTFDRYPNLRMVIPHLGECYPYVVTSMDEALNAAGPDEFNRKKHDVKWYFTNRNILISTSGVTSPDAFACAIAQFGVEDIVIGSDYSLETLTNATECLKALAISEEDRDKIRGGNFEKFIKRTSWEPENGVMVTYGNGVLTLGGTNEACSVPDYAADEAPWAAVMADVKSVVVAANVKKVGENALYGLSEGARIHGMSNDAAQSLAKAIDGEEEPAGAIDGGAFERIEIEDGKVLLGVSVCTNGDLTAATESWGKAKVEAVGLDEAIGTAILTVPATAEKGFMILKPKSVGK